MKKSTLMLLLLTEFRMITLEKSTLVSGNATDKKIFTPAAANFFWVNLIEFFKQSLHLKNYSDSTFFVEKQGVLPFKAGVHFRFFSAGWKKSLRHENIYQGSGTW